MRTPRVAVEDPALATLRTLLEVNSQIAREHYEERVTGVANEQARGTLEAVTLAAEEQRDELLAIIREWERAQRRPREATPRAESAGLSTRELIESWLAIKESAAEVYVGASRAAPNSVLQRRLEALAREEQDYAERLRNLL